MRKFLLLFFGLALGFNSYAQSLNSIKGRVLESETQTSINEVKATLQGTTFSVFSDAEGAFVLENVPNGEYVLQLSKVKYENLYLPVSVQGKTVDLGDITLYTDLYSKLDSSVITLSEEELTEYKWQPFPLKILKDNLQYYLNADKDIQKIEKLINKQEDIVSTLKEIVESINKRTFVIKNTIDYLKWVSGM